MNEEELPNPSAQAAQDPSSDPTMGSGIVRTTVIGVAVFAVLGLGAAIWESMTGAYVVVSLLQFFIGVVVFVLAFLRAIDRSRTEAIGIGGLFFGSGSTPKRVQLILMLSLTVQVVVSIVVASIHLYTALAFGVLAPMWALGFTGLWVAAYGRFPQRAPEPTLAARRDAARRTHRESAPRKHTNDVD